jgi:CheY-like chemotaxis protein
MSEFAGKRLLLVDDETDVRRSIAMLIEALGVTVTHAGDARSALALYAPGRFDAVMTDFTMPGMDGLKLAQTLREADPGQRVIMVSGFAEQVIRNGKLPPWINAFVPKPCSLAELGEALNAVWSAPPYVPPSAA